MAVVATELLIAHEWVLSLESGGRHLRQEAEELTQSRSMQPEYSLSLPATATQADVKERATAALQIRH